MTDDDGRVLPSLGSALDTQGKRPRGVQVPGTPLTAPMHTRRHSHERPVGATDPGQQRDKPALGHAYRGKTTAKQRMLTRWPPRAMARGGRSTRPSGGPAPARDAAGSRPPSHREGGCHPRQRKMQLSAGRVPEPARDAARLAGTRHPLPTYPDDPPDAPQGMQPSGHLRCEERPAPAQSAAAGQLLHLPSMSSRTWNTAAM